MAQRVSVDTRSLDIDVNGEEVYPVAEALAARGIPFVFVTGYASNRLRAPYRDSPTLPKDRSVKDYGVTGASGR